MGSHSVQTWECHQTAAGFGSIVGLFAAFLLGEESETQNAIEECWCGHGMDTWHLGRMDTL